MKVHWVDQLGTSHLLGRLYSKRQETSVGKMKYNSCTVDRNINYYNY